MKRKLLSLALCLALSLTLAPAALATDGQPAEETAAVLTRIEPLDLTGSTVYYQSAEKTTVNGVTTNVTKTDVPTNAVITDTAEGWAWYPGGTTVDSTAYTGKVLVLSGINMDVPATVGSGTETAVPFALNIPDGTTVVRTAGSSNVIARPHTELSKYIAIQAAGTVAFAGSGSLTTYGAFVCDNLSTAETNVTTYAATSVTVSGGDMFVVGDFFYTTNNNACTGSLNISAKLVVGYPSDSLDGYPGGFQIYGYGPITVASGKFKNCGGAFVGSGDTTVKSGAVIDEGTGSNARTGTITVENGGTYYFESGSTRESIVVNAGGIATGGYAASGTINGNFTCHGTMSLICTKRAAYAGTLRINGNLDISGATLTLSINDETPSKLIVSGSSNISGATLHITGTPISGTKYNYLTSQDGITGTITPASTAAQHLATNVEGNNAYVTVSSITPPAALSVPVQSTVSVDQGKNSVEVNTRVNGSAATVELSSGAQAASDTETLSVDASSLGSGVTELDLGQNLVDRAAQSGGLDVTLPNGNKVEFTKEAAQGAAQELAGEPLKLSLSTGDTDAGISAALKGVVPAAVINLNISKGGKELHEFAGDVTATVSTGAADGGSSALDLLHLKDALPQQVSNWSATSSSVTLTTNTASPFVLVKKGSVQTEAPFTDVSADGWAYTGVKYCWYYGMVSGTSADTFSPDAALTRAQLWTILARLDGRTLSGGAMVAARTWAVGIGVTDGSNPTAAVTREQLAATLWRYAKYKNRDVSVGEDTNILSYDDALGISEYAVPAVQWACGAGVLNGSGSKLLPRDAATRAQAATMLMRFCRTAA